MRLRPRKPPQPWARTSSPRGAVNRTTPDCPPALSCPECFSTDIRGDSEGGCGCPNGHVFWDTESWEWKSIRRAQAAELALVRLAERCGPPAEDADDRDKSAWVMACRLAAAQLAASVGRRA